MWTYSGFFIERREDKLFVYASDKKELEMFADENGCLIGGQVGKEYADIIANFCRATGVYQVLIGYGTHQEITVYGIKRIAETDWSFGGN